MTDTKYTIKYMRSCQEQQLYEAVRDARYELFKLRLKVATDHVASFPSDQRTLKKAVARALTLITEKNRRDNYDRE